MPFVIVPWALLDDDTLTAHDVLVYATIARYADRATGEAWPSRSTVARMARCDIKTVDRSVSRLVDSGMLEKKRRKTVTGDDSNLYIVHEVAHRGGDFNGARGGTLTVQGGGTLTVHELQPIELDEDALNLSEPSDPSEWTGMPQDVRDMLPKPTTGSTP